MNQNLWLDDCHGFPDSGQIYQYRHNINEDLFVFIVHCTQSLQVDILKPMLSVAWTCIEERKYSWM